MSEPIKDGGTAFPVTHQEDASGNVRQWGELGMSLRDYFAIRCLPISRSTFPDGLAGGWEELAVHSYSLADAMLKARQS